MEGVTDSKGLPFYLGAKLSLEIMRKQAIVLVLRHQGINTCLLSESPDFSLAYTGSELAISYLIMLGSHPISIYFG